MTCTTGGNLTICSTPTVAATRRVMKCPTCKRRTRHVVAHQSIWYAPTVTCVACGDSWSDGFRRFRPTNRGWRIKATALARTVWDNAITRTQMSQVIADEIELHRTAGAN